MSHMASQTALGSRGFRVTRDTEARKSYDPCAGIQFSPPIDSDELFEALKDAFPNWKTHRQRMRQALIEFLGSEVEAENSVAGLKADASTSADEVTSGNSNNRSSEAVATLQPKVTKPNGNSLQDMTIVWPRGELKPRRRRKLMTEDERLQYRQRRALGVCSLCRKQKRKCRHTKSDIEEEQPMLIITHPKLDPPKDSADANRITGVVSTKTNSRPLKSTLPPPSAVCNGKDTSLGQVSTGFTISSLIASPPLQDPTQSADSANFNLEPGLQETSAWHTYGAQPRKSNTPTTPSPRPQCLGNTKEEGRHLYYSTAGPDDFDLGWLDAAIQSGETFKTDRYLQQFPHLETSSSMSSYAYGLHTNGNPDVLDLIGGMEGLSVCEDNSGYWE